MIRREQTPPPLSLTGGLGKLSDAQGATFHIADHDNVSILLSPCRDVCLHKHIFVITSAPQNIKLRNKVREYVRGRAGIVFLLGVPSSYEQRNSSLEVENDQHGDILQGDFPDSYPHLSHKVIMSFIWTNKHCLVDQKSDSENPRFLIKMDDDSVIDYEDLAARLDYEDLYNGEEDCVYCPSVLKNQKLWRHKAAPMMGKWAYMSDNFTRTYLPDYCNGNLYSLRPRVGLALAEGSRPSG